MTPLLRSVTRLASAAGLVLLAAGCAQTYPRPPAVAYNPPAATLAALPPSDVTRYHVSFATNSYQIDTDGQTAVDGAADVMGANAALTATVIGSADPVGSDASNMLLSKQRATAVHNALLRTGKVSEQRIETRWTGDRQPDAQAAPTQGNGADASYRSVEIALH